MEIKVTQRDVYGNSLFYPACEKAEILAMISNSKTLTRRTLKLAKDLGFDIQFKQATPSVNWLVESCNEE